MKSRILGQKLKLCFVELLLLKPLLRSQSGFAARYYLITRRRQLTRAKLKNCKHCATVIFLSSIVFNSSAFSEDYYWRAAGGQPARFSSALAACQFDQNYNSYGHVLRMEQVKNSERPLVGCVYYYSTASNSAVFQGGASYARFGDSCPSGKENPSTGECSQVEQQGRPEPLACQANPINIAIGNKFQVEGDYQPVGSSMLEFHRAYNSLDGIWRHNYSTYLRFGSAGNVALVFSDGHESFFTVSGATVTPGPAELGALINTSTGWLYTSNVNERFNFNADGQLIEWMSAFGRVVKLAYFAGTVTASDEAGNKISFTEDYRHQPLTFSAGSRTINYIYDSHQRLVKVDKNTGAQIEARYYHYENATDPKLLTGITDARGVRFATWEYDSEGRAISSEHANGNERTEITYNSDGSRTVKNVLGRSTVYRFANAGGLSKVIAVEGEPSANCPASNSTFTYNNRGQVLTQTDAKGFITTHTYNDRGLETSRTEASGTPQARTTTTTWHTTFNLPLTVTEPGQQTTYTYDAQGRQTARTQTAL